MPEILNADVLNGLLKALDRAADSLSLPQLTALATVALRPGLSVNDLAEAMSVPQQSASRHVAVLLGRYQEAVSAPPDEPLITQAVSADDPRKRALFLSSAGTELLKKVAEPLTLLVSKGK